MPFPALAEYEFVPKVFTLPSGLSYPYFQIVKKAHALVLPETKFDIYSYVFSRVDRLPIREEYVAYMLKMSDKYGASVEELAKVAVCESGLTQYGRGKWGLIEGKANELGIFQYKLGTWIAFEEEFKREELTIRDAFDQIELTSLVFSKGEEYKNHWSCYMKHFNYPLYKKYFP